MFLLNSIVFLRIVLHIINGFNLAKNKRFVGILSIGKIRSDIIKNIELMDIAPNVAVSLDLKI